MRYLCYPLSFRAVKSALRSDQSSLLHAVCVSLRVKTLSFHFPVLCECIEKGASCFAYEGCTCNHTKWFKRFETMGNCEPQCSWASLVAQMVKNLPAMRETRVPSLGWEGPLEEGMAAHSSILAWRIPWTEGPGGL